MLVLAWEKLSSALVMAMERCEQGLYLDNSLPETVRGTKPMYDGSHIQTPRLVCRVRHLHGCALALPSQNITVSRGVRAGGCVVGRGKLGI